MKILITIMGRSVWGLVNSAWASARSYGFVPEKVHILSTKTNGLNSRIAGDMLKVVLREYGAEPAIVIETVEGGDMGGISSKVREIIDSYEDADVIAMDVTSGTKDLVLGSTTGHHRKRLKHLFYLRLDNLKNVNKPYILIPANIQHTHDILGEVGL